MRRRHYGDGKLLIEGKNNNNDNDIGNSSIQQRNHQQKQHHILLGTGSNRSIASSNLRRRRRKSERVTGSRHQYSLDKCRNTCLKVFGILFGLLFIYLLLFYLLYPRTFKHDMKYYLHGGSYDTSADELEEQYLFGNRTAVQELFRKYRYNHTNNNNDNPPVIFYNVYIPNNNHALKHVIEIIQEQLNLVYEILFVQHNEDQNYYNHDNSSSNDNGRTVTVYYNTIGANKHEIVEDVCYDINQKLQKQTQQKKNQKQQILECNHMKHYYNATEEVTLMKLYNYCQNDNNQTYNSSRVVYIHSKGTYHDNIANKAWRYALTKAAIQCSIIQNFNCQVCGLQFFTMFTIMYPGNMWSAECSYIRTLHPPNKEFQNAIEKVIKKFLLLRSYGIMNSRLLRDRIDYYGLNRYYIEHWIGSTPNLLIPCDMYPKRKLQSLYTRHHIQNPILELSYAPRHVGFPVGNNINAHRRLQKNITERLREYFLLPGHILKWYIIYGKVPNKDSWVWKWYPDGDYWLSKIQQYGPEYVIEHVNNNNDEISSALITIGNNNLSSLDSSEWIVSNNNNINNNAPVLFYHVIDMEPAVIEAVHEQFDIISQSYAARVSTEPIILYISYTKSNSNNKDNLENQIDNLCTKYNDNIDCRYLPVTTTEKNDDSTTTSTIITFQRIYQFCKTQKDDKRIVYIHNSVEKLSSSQTTASYTHATNLLRHLTMAVTSEECLQKPNFATKDTTTLCNVCGLIFYTMWDLMFPGGMFTASCSYIQKLIPPINFIQRMDDTISQILLAKIRTQITSNLYPDSTKYLGLGIYAMDHWIGSHPTIQPCDVSNSKYNLDYWVGIERNVSTFEWGLAPRHTNDPYGLINVTKKKYVIQNENYRIREIQYLAGHLLKWLYLYHGEISSNNSWVWSWFPDGNKWKDGVLKYGINNVVTAMTKQYAVDDI